MLYYFYTGVIRLSYYNKTPINNPMNIKRILGDLPTASSSSKNVGIILVVFTILAITFSRVWGLLLSIIGNTIISGVIMFLVYAFILFRVFALTVFEERKKKKAFLDFMENKVSDISTIWELQNIKEHTTERGTKFAYIDYIDGTRAVVLKCIYGSILNQGEDSEELHVQNTTKIMNDISAMGFMWEPVCKPIQVNDDKILNMYYKSTKEFEDVKFVHVFTQILDTIDYLANNVSAVYAVYFYVFAQGRYKHGMFEKLENIPAKFRGKTSFDYVNFIDTEFEMDKMIANELGVNLYDREELVMKKYHDTVTVGETAVIYAYGESDEVLKQFNKELSIERKVEVKSFDLSSNARSSSLKASVDESDGVELQLIPTAKEVVIEETYEEIKITVTKKDSEFIRLLYEEDEIKLG